MEIPSVLGCGLSRRAFACPLLTLIPSGSPPAARASDSQFTYEAKALVKETVTAPPSSVAPASAKKRHLYLARKAAVLELQQSSDLNSALERCFPSPQLMLNSCFSSYNCISSPLVSVDKL